VDLSGVAPGLSDLAADQPPVCLLCHSALAGGEFEPALGVRAKKCEQELATSASVAILYGALGESDQAFAWLEKAYQERDPEFTYIKVPGRSFEPLNHDPRFQEFVRRVGPSE